MRSVSEIETEMSKLEEQREILKRQLRELEQERCAALALAELAAMPPEKRAALRRGLELVAASVESGEMVGTPGA